MSKSIIPALCLSALLAASAALIGCGGPEPANGAAEASPETAQSAQGITDVDFALRYCVTTELIGQYDYAGQCVGAHVLIRDWCIIADAASYDFGVAIPCNAL